MRRPDHYRTPLRSRTDIATWLANHQSYYRGNDAFSSPFAWNVRNRGANLSFPRLVEVYQTNFGELRNGLDLLQGWYEQLGSNLYTQAHEETKTELHNCYQYYWEGGMVQSEYALAGTRFDWLLLSSFEGYPLWDVDEKCLYVNLLDNEEWPFDKLRRLYQLIVKNDYDLRPAAVTARIELQAAIIVFDRIEEHK